MDAGYADQLLLGGDMTTPEAPGLPYLLRRLRLRLEPVLRKDVMDRIFVRNPARAFTVGRS
ncbi:hypothetical protein ACWDZ6_24890 [Streptomyces sp. NPDC002926]